MDAGGDGTPLPLPGMIPEMDSEIVPSPLSSLHAHSDTPMADFHAHMAASAADSARPDPPAHTHTPPVVHAPSAPAPGGSDYLHLSLGARGSDG